MAVRIVNKKGVADTYTDLVDGTYIPEERDIIYLASENISYMYSDGVFTNISETEVEIIEDTILNNSYHGKTVILNASLVDITLTWDVSIMDGTVINFIRVDNSNNRIFISDKGLTGTETYIGNPLPFDLGMIQYDALPLTSKLDTIYINN